MGVKQQCFPAFSLRTHPPSSESAKSGWRTKEWDQGQEQEEHNIGIKSCSIVSRVLSADTQEMKRDQSLTIRHLQVLLISHVLKYHLLLLNTEKKLTYPVLFCMYNLQIWKLNTGCIYQLSVCVAIRRSYQSMRNALLWLKFSQVLVHDHLTHYFGHWYVVALCRESKMEYDGFHNGKTCG